MKACIVADTDYSRNQWPGSWSSDRPSSAQQPIKRVSWLREQFTSAQMKYSGNIQNARCSNAVISRGAAR